MNRTLATCPGPDAPPEQHGAGCPVSATAKLMQHETVPGALTPESLAELRRLLDDGSTRPWVAFRANDPNPGGRGWVGVTRDIDVDYAPDIFASQRCAPRDAVLIAAAVNALPALLDAAEERDALLTIIDDARHALAADGPKLEPARQVLARALPQLAAWQDRKRRDRDITPPHVIAHRGAQLDAVTAERDALAARLEGAEAVIEVQDVHARQVIAERDEAMRALGKLTAERDAEPDRIAELTAERDALAAMVAGRCLSDITHRDEEHRQSFCMLPAEHAPLAHDDCMGCTWTDAEHWEPSAIDALAAAVERVRALADHTEGATHRCNPGNVWECPACWSDRVRHALDGGGQPMSRRAPDVLDPTSGTRAMWCDKGDPRALFGDLRAESVTVPDGSHGKPDGTRTLTVAPDLHAPGGPAMSADWKECSVVRDRDDLFWANAYDENLPGGWWASVIGSHTGEALESWRGPLTPVLDADGLPVVRTVGDLTARHVGKRVRLETDRTLPDRVRLLREIATASTKAVRLTLEVIDHPEWFLKAHFDLDTPCEVLP